MGKDNNRNGFLFLKIVFWVVGIFIFLLLFLGPTVIRNCNLQSEQDMITLGGSKSDATKSTLNCKNKIKLLNELVDSVANTIKPLFIYTNDSLICKGILSPNMKHEVLSRSGLGRPLIKRNNEVIDEISSFFNKKDSLGYGIKIWLKDQQQYLNIAKINNLHLEQKFSVITFYYYTEQEKEDIRKHLNSSPARSLAYNKIKEKQLKSLEELQCSSVILTETELQNQKIKSGCRGLFAPRNKSIHTGHKFYFSAYNGQINMEQFKVKVNQFVTMFLTNKNTDEYYYREIKLSSSY